MGKILFRFKLQSLSDVVTNSSSELFVFKNHNMEAVKLTLDALYPDWRNEYQEPQWVKDMDDETFKEYLYWVLGTDPYRNEDWRWDIDRSPEEKCKDWVEREKDSVYHNFYKELSNELNEDPEKLYTNWEVYNPYSKEWEKAFIKFSDYGISKLKEYLADDIALWSLDDNPDWDYQEKLMEVAKRYHLG